MLSRAVPILVVLILEIFVYVNGSIDFEKTIREASYNIDLIYQRYEFYKPNYQFFLGSSNMDTDSWDLLKYKFIEKMTRPSGNAEFIMIFGGSSVTAGHDSFYNESYPFVTERRMKDAFSAAGVSLIVQNIAQGANQCLPSEWCYNSMGGGWEPEPKELGKAIPADRSKALDGSGYDVHADFLSWEQSFNCGRVPAMFELMARNAGRQNAVLYFASSGSFPHNEKCAPSKDKIPRISEQWRPENDQKLMMEKLKRSKEDAKGEKEKDGGLDADSYHEYIPDRTAVAALRDLLAEWHLKAPCVSRFTQPLGKNYKMVAAHGFNVWSSSKGICKHPLTGESCDPVEAIGDCADKGGPKWITKEATRYTKLQYGHSHHPPTAQHLIRGEILAYNYLHIFLDALYTVQDEATIHKSSLGDINAKYALMLSKIQDQKIPEPSKVPEKFINVIGYAPKCYTDYEPHYNPKYELSQVVVGSDTHGWQRNNGLAFTPKGLDARWGYQDNRPYYTGHGWNLTIGFSFELTHGDSIYVCGYKRPKALTHALFFIEFDVPRFDSEESRKSFISGSSRDKPPILWPKREELGDDTECVRLYQIPQGHHVLTVSTGGKPAPNSREMFASAVTHLISF